MTPRFAALSGAGAVGFPLLVFVLMRELPDEVLRAMPYAASIPLVFVVASLIFAALLSMVVFATTVIAGGD